MLTQEYLKQIVNYDAETGIFIWKIKRRGTKGIGNTAGNENNFTGYLAFCINGKKYYCHRLAWLYKYGYMPKYEIDHINKNKQDNRISNLRESTRTENLANTKIRKNNNIGYKNVSLHKKTGLWRVTITKNKVCVENKYFINLNDAVSYSINARRKHFGNFANDC